MKPDLSTTEENHQIVAKIAPERFKTFGRIFAFICVLGLSILIVAYADKVKELGAYGYPGLFLFALVTSATVILPAPGLILVFSMGAVFNPLGVALAAGTGAALGELSGYIAGLSGQVVIENTKTYLRIREWMAAHTRISGWMIFLLAFLPLPIFDMAGMAAGALRMPVRVFLIWVWFGKVLKLLAVAYLGTTWLIWWSGE